jgi:serine/threonine protein kinase/Skp family chaperone for outer membrane proteins
VDDLSLGQTVRGFAPGQKLFDRYVLKSILGRGGMGIVWRACDQQLERDVALKFLPDLIIHDRAVLDDLKRETKRCLELTHYNIVRIYDFAQDDQSACICMEYVDGETLSALRVDHPSKVFEAAELSQIVVELCEALDYAHTRARIVHRDLKPANLMVNSKGVLKITDFGIARSLSDSVSMLTTATSSGTLLYMSPQQLEGERPSPLDDIYSVGATLYELLTSKPPFFSGGIERQIRDKPAIPMAVRRQDLGITSMVKIPEYWERTVAACLAKNPADRPQTANELATRFREEAPPVLLAPSAPAPSPPRVASIVPPASVTPPPRAPTASPPPEPSISSTSAPVSSATQSPPRKQISKALIFAAVTCLVVTLSVLPAYFFRGRSSNIRTAQQAPASAHVVPSQPATTNVEETPLTSPTQVPSPTSRSYGSNAGYDPAIAFVDMNRVFKQYSKTKDAEAKVNDAKGAAKKEYDDRANAYKRALDAINQLNKQLDSPSLGASAKAEKARERDGKIADIKTMEREINDFRTTREKQLQEQALKMREGIVAEITTKVKTLSGTVANLLFDKSGMSLNGVPVIMYSPDRTDMSDKVVSALNQNQSSPFVAARGLNVGLVDMNRIFKEYDKTKDAEAKVNDAKNSAKKEYDDRADAYKKALDEVNYLNKELDSSSLGAASKTQIARDRDSKIAKIKTMEREINDFRTTREKQLQEQALKMREGIVKEITTMTFSGLKSSPNPILIDSSGMTLNGVPVVLFSSGVPDLSNDVIAALNQKRASVTFSHSLLSVYRLRFGVVDMNRAFKAWPETKPAEAKINDAKNAAKKEYDDRANTYKSALDEINRLNKELDSSSLGASAKAEKARERDGKIADIKTIEKEINDFRTSREKQVQEQAMKMREAIVAKIMAALKARAEDQQFNIIFDSSGNSLNGVPLVLFSNDLPDLTNDLVQ